MCKLNKFLFLILMVTVSLGAQPENRKMEKPAPPHIKSESNDGVQVKSKTGISNNVSKNQTMAEVNAPKYFEIGLGGYKILQAPNMTTRQMMSYLVITPNKKLIVIDGGTNGDAGYLTEKIHQFGSVVSMWIITHVHSDHYGALVEILQQLDLNGITIEKLCYHFPPAEWIYEAEPQYLKNNKVFLDLLPQFSHITQILQEHEKYNVDGLVIDILKVPTDYNDYDPAYKKGSTVNDTSIAFKVIFPNGKTALFLGDLGLRAGHKLAKRFKEKLKSDIVQMAHHGQNGAGEDVYQWVRPTLCMWTAPLWLYDNNAGLRDPEAVNKFNSHHYKTVIVRGWMEKLGVKMHAVEGEGPAWIL
jgi:beta-lactamase superfamily II metal-dependent hydrolase